VQEVGRSWANSVANLGEITSGATQKGWQGDDDPAKVRPAKVRHDRLTCILLLI
jgi:hypothetical protein